jgi:hypothetical protein
MANRGQLLSQISKPIYDQTIHVTVVGHVVGQAIQSTKNGCVRKILMTVDGCGHRDDTAGMGPDCQT